MNQLFILIGAISMAIPALAQTHEDIEAQIKRLDARRLKAFIDGGIETLDRILSSGLVYTHASGWRQNKAELLASIRSGELKYRAFTMRSVSMQVHGSTVIATGEASAQVRSKGQELNVSLLFLEVYVRQDGRWQLVAWQSTANRPVPDR